MIVEEKLFTETPELSIPNPSIILQAPPIIVEFEDGRKVGMMRESENSAKWLLF